MSRRFVINSDGLPDLSGMMLSVVDALRQIGGSATIQELDEKVIEIEGVSEEEQSHLMPNETSARFNYYMAWARTFLKRGDALENSFRGVWSLTDTGSEIQTSDETKLIYDQVNLEERERARQKRQKKKQDGSKAHEAQSNLPLEISEEDGVGFVQDWKMQLLVAIREMTPSGFERLAQRLLREAGFSKVEVRGKSGDGGIDGVGVLRVNLVTFQVYFQCKKWKGSVGAKEVRDFRGAMQGRADKGLFITTGKFTGQASDEATRDGAMAIDLIDGDRLCGLLKDNGLGITTEMIEKVTIDENWFRTV